MHWHKCHKTQTEQDKLTDTQTQLTGDWKQAYVFWVIFSTVTDDTDLTSSGTWS